MQHLVLTAGKRNKHFNELTVLAMTMYNSGSSGVPIYHGYDHEDFDEFVESLYSHYCLKGIEAPTRQIIILRSQLWGSACITYDMIFVPEFECGNV